MSGAVATVAAPSKGIWRIGRGADPLSTPPWLARLGTGGSNRFDPLTLNYPVLYFGTTLEACFGETLARFRPSVAMLALVEEEWAKLGFMNVGVVPTDWRSRRSAVNVVLRPGVRFVDVDSPVTHQVLRRELASGLAALGLSDLDVSTVRGPDRRVTQMISEWVYLNGDGSDRPIAGVRYESRLRAGWECWALFGDREIELEVASTVPITLDMPELATVGQLFGLKIF